MRITWTLLLLPIILLAKTPIVIDTNAEIDDLIAILFLLKADEIDIKAITTTISEKEIWDTKIDRLLNALQLSGSPNIPVSYGSSDSLSPRFFNETTKIKEEDTRYSLPDNPNVPSLLRSADLLTETLKNADETISIVSFAPLTNVALALRKCGSLKRKIERIYVMGGAIDVPSYVINDVTGPAKKYSEYNLAKDALAAYEVFFSGVPITLVPLDAIFKVSVLNEIYVNLVRLRAADSVNNFLFSITQPLVLKYYNSEDYFWNLIASTILLEKRIGRFQTAKALINLEEGEEYGKLLLHRRGVPLEICTNINTPLFYSLFNKILR